MDMQMLLCVVVQVKCVPQACAVVDSLGYTAFWLTRFCSRMQTYRYQHAVTQVVDGSGTLATWHHEDPWSLILGVL